MYRIYDQESGELLEEEPTGIHFYILRRIAKFFADGADPDCLGVALEILGLETEEANDLLKKAMDMYMEEGNAYQAFLHASQNVPFVEVLN
jgi:hypothetical protein